MSNEDVVVTSDEISQLKGKLEKKHPDINHIIKVYNAYIKSLPVKTVKVVVSSEGTYAKHE
jgi:hypothetical protein